MSRSRDGWRRGPVRPLLAVLLLMLCLSGVLAYQAWDAARSHRQVTEAALRDYAGFALWELRRRVESNARMTLSAALMPALTGRFARRDTTMPPFLGRLALREAPAPGLIGFAQGVESALRVCACAGTVSDYFTIDLETLDLEVQDARLGPEFRHWLTAGFLENARSRGRDVEPDSMVRTHTQADGRIIAVRTALPGNLLMVEAPLPFDSSRAVVYTTVPGGGRRLYGFAVDIPEFARALIEQAVSGPPLLPASLTGAAANDEVLSLAVWSAAGDTVFRTSGAINSGAEVLDTLHLVTGSLLAGVAVRPEVAGRLVIGGLPRSRLPILVGSIGLTLALLLIALLQLRRQQELFRLRADFVSGVSHELRTPLAQIRLFSDLLASERLDDGQRRRSVRILSEEAKRLTYLVENVLRFSRSERRMERIAPSPLEVGPLLRQIAEDFAPLARSREARIVVDAPDGLRAPLDADAMRQVLLNLLDNAVKYGPRGQTIRVNALRHAERLRIEVEDEGPGIPPAERERIWEPYRRLAREIEAATGGSGIGLAVARELVELHGGRAFATDAPGGGSRFVIQLPRAAAPAPVPAEQAACEATRGAEV